VNPLISVVIPVKNGARWLRDLLEHLHSQTLAQTMEIIVIDSGSTDESISICREYHAIVHEIAPSTFNHGLTRNLGVDLSKGEFVLMTVQDALPVENTFLEELIKGFKDDSVVAVCGLQVVPALSDTSPLSWHRPISPPEISYYEFDNLSAFDSLGPQEKRYVCRWDDVCAMYRRSVISKLRFPEISFGEDMAWCKEALRRGYKICYHPAAKVYHHHHESGDILYRRFFAEYFSAYQLFGLLPTKNNFFLTLVKAAYRLMKEKGISWRKKWYWFIKEYKDQRIFNKSSSDFIRQQRISGQELEEFHNNLLRETPPKSKSLIL
jgi:rhamnosyltransferase